MQLNVGLSKMFCAEAANMSYHIINRSLHTVLDSKGHKEIELVN